MLKLPHTAAVAGNDELTTTNGKSADGTGAGAYHRFVLDIASGSKVQVLWSSDGVGVATHIKVWGSPKMSSDRKLDNEVPTPYLNGNPLWGPETPWKFIDGASLETIPNGVATTGTLNLWDVAQITLLVEVLVGVDIPSFGLDCAVKGT